MDFSLGYKDFRKFLKQYNDITYPEFDYYSVNDLNLFSTLEDIDFDEISQRLSEIEKLLPAIKRIFAKPIIHLIDEDVLVPVEAVRLISNKTMSYASVHSEHWEDVTEKGIKPRKLLTNNYRDNYAIYENIVFSRCVDYILNYVRHYTHILSDMIYTNKKLEIDLLERENHMSYYLALGKLETGYIRSFTDYADTALRLIARMEYVYSTLQARLKRPVYTNCHKIKGKIRLRKTNILAMHKDYRIIYRYLKKIYNEDLEEFKEEVDPRDYVYYCKCLTLFAAGHFNFQMDKTKTINFKKLDADFEFKGYKLNIKDTTIDGVRALLLTFYKDKEYQMLLVPNSNGFKVNVDIETHYLSPDLDTDDTFISISNIDSFRRIQQLLLRGMVFANEKFDVCPFCGGTMQHEEGLNSYYCSKCRTEIRKEHCINTDKDYFVTGIKNFKLKKEKLNMAKRSLYQKRMLEGLMNFRNITRITSELAEICPHCGMVHKASK